MHSKFKYFEMEKIKKKGGLKGNVPGMKKTLQMIEFLKEKKVHLLRLWSILLVILLMTHVFVYLRILGHQPLPIFVLQILYTLKQRLKAQTKFAYGSG